MQALLEEDIESLKGVGNSFPTANPRELIARRRTTPKLCPDEFLAEDDGNVGCAGS